MGRDRGARDSAAGGERPADTPWLHRVIATLGEGFAVLDVVRDPGGRVVDLRYLLGGPQRPPGAVPRLDDAVGRLISEVIPDAGPWWIETHAAVADSGVPLVVPQALEEIGRWYTMTTFPAGPDRILVVIDDVTDERTAVAVVQERESRQRYLVALLDALRPLVDPGAIQGEAARLLGDHLGADRVFYAELDAQEGIEHLRLRGGYVAGGLSQIVGRFPLSVIGRGVIDAARRGDTCAVKDIGSVADLTDADRAAFARQGVHAYIAVPLVKQGRLVAILAVGQTRTRAWTGQEVSLVEETAERTWSAVERAHAEAALRESELRYGSLFESIDEGFFEAELIRDADGRPVDMVYLDANPAFERDAGRSRDQLLGHRRSEYFPADPETLGLIAGAIDSGRAQRFEQQLTVTGRWYDLTVIPRLGQRFALLLDNAKERRDAERLLREAEARQSLLVRLEDVLRPLDDPGAVHREATRLLGEFLGTQRCSSIQVDADRAVVRGQHTQDVPPLPAQFPVARLSQAVVEAYRRGETMVVEDMGTDERFSDAERSDARPMCTRSMVGAALQGEGRWAGAIAVGDERPRTWTHAEVDLVVEVAQRTWAASARAEAEAALRASEAKHRLLFETISEAFVLGEVFRATDGRVDIRFLEINPAFDRVTGGGREILLHRTAREAAPDLDPRWYDIAERAGLGRETVRREYPLRDGRWLETLVTPVGAPGGGGVAMVSSDITERRLAEEQRDERLRNAQVAREEAEAAARLREEFLAIVSHELRTPLAAILLWSRLLASGRAAGREQEAIETIERNAEAQRALIEDLLDASRMLSGVVLDPRAQPLAPVVVEAIDALRPQADERRITLEVELDQALRVAVDPARFRQVVRNLVDNAIRYTHVEGSVRICLARAGGMAELVVADTGRGIAGDLLPHVFERFRRGERGGGGLGLGLAIAQDIVLRHHGTIDVASPGPGRGATFTVRLRLARRSSRRATTPAPDA